jgi:hypothetical protein
LFVDVINNSSTKQKSDPAISVEDIIMQISTHFPPRGSKKLISNYEIQRSIFVAAIFMSTYMSFSGVSRAEDAPSGEPAATVKIQQVQVAFIGSGSLGGGTLNYQGKSYRITVGGLGIGGIGASQLTASGSVYGLTRRRDFAGAYIQLRSGWALADSGKGTMWLRNSNGVTMKLRTQRKGLQLALGADGIVIGFK